MPRTSGNPFNHQAPVRDSEYFAGREAELEDIRYNLDLATSDRPQFIHMGITGKEGSGKSSLSYMVEAEANDRNLSVLRLNLDARMVTDQVEFFTRVYEELTTITGGEYEESYIKAARHKIEGTLSQAELNLKYLKLYFGANSDENLDVSEGVLRQDLTELYGEIDSNAVVIILDNAQQLARNTVLLQKLKNIFTNIDGYMLVLVGTEDTFSEISSAFSPVARMFDKHHITPFEDSELTEECILKPLDGDDREDIAKGTIEEIHRITGGRPYEINLICHHMYRKYDKGDIDSLQLTSGVIDEVVDQLENWRRPIDDAILEKLEEYDIEKLRTLISVVEYPKNTITEVARYSTLSKLGPDFKGSVSSLHEEETRRIQELVDDDLIEGGGSLSFNGDLYALTYLKYYAVSEGIIDSLGVPTEGGLDSVAPNLHYRTVDKLILSDVQAVHTHFVAGGESAESMKSVVNTHEAGGGPMSERRSERLATFEDYYLTSGYDLEHEGRVTYEGRTEDFRINFNWADTSIYSVVHIDNDDVEQVKRKINEVVNHVRPLLGDLDIEILEKTEWDYVDEAGATEDSEEAIELIDNALDINQNAPTIYLARANQLSKLGNHQDALKDIEKAIEIQPKFTWAYEHKAQVLSNMGDMEAARDAIESALELKDDSAGLEETAAHIYSGVNEPELELKYANAVLEDNPENHHALIHAMLANDRLGNDEDLIGLYERLGVDCPPESNQFAKIHYLAMGYYRDMEKYEEALSVLSELDRDPDTPQEEIDYEVACIRALQGEKDKALSHLENAVNVDDDYRDIAENDVDFECLHEDARFQSLVNKSG